MIKYISVYFLICSSCYSQVDSRLCIENEKFKTYFFSNISTIEKVILDTNKYILSNKDIRKFHRSLSEINHYISTLEFVNYGYKGAVYPDSLEFFEYKKDWLKWYELNKCLNLKKHRKQFYSIDNECRN